MRSRASSPASCRRILFGLLAPSLGGHTRTAIALAEVLRDRGHTIEFLVAPSAAAATTDQAENAALVRAAGFPVVSMSSGARPNGRTFRVDLRQLVQRHGYDAMHWFEFYAGVRNAALAAREAPCAFVWTVASGGLPVSYYGLNRVVVFTPEVARDVRRRSPHTAVHLLPARVNFRLFERDIVEADRRAVRHRFGIADTDILIVRVARAAGVYFRSIAAGISLARRLNATGRSAVFLHAGYVHDPDVARDIRALVDRANADAGRRIAWSITEDVESGIRYAAAADVCIASGRSALEALALERPTLVAWGSRYLGIASDSNIQRLADTNFQGRQSEKITSDENLVARMFDDARARLSQRDESARIGARCAEFIRERYSVERAADTYETLYADRTIAVHGALRHYGNPRLLVREILHRLPSRLRRGRAAASLKRARSWAVPAGSDE